MPLQGSHGAVASGMKNKDVKIGTMWTFNVTLMRNHQLRVSCVLVKVAFLRTAAFKWQKVDD